MKRREFITLLGGDASMDGAIAANTPVRLAADLGASRIIILPTGYACALREPPTSAIGRALHAVTLMITWQLMHELDGVLDLEGAHREGYPIDEEVDRGPGLAASSRVSVAQPAAS